ncbi:NAD-dependent epimerase/dehydratase family protein [Candidatus Uhrbacteria bacterium]|nr:NAD-dependent epimerase/dehydratase family protein [Candidatus Uhrbacteria bacterium]MBD3284006.1 NAD-dependent epimerase/dehydratase family protein [Candidatus Uhrbacteria bacterium]
MSKYLVTGGAGFIGSTLAKRLLRDGHEVIILDNLSTGKRENLPEGVAFYEVDLCDLDAIRDKFEGVDGVFHVAAMPRVPYSVEHPIESSKNNIFSTLNTFVAARDAGVKRVVYSASSSAYGGNPSLPQHTEMKPDPLSPYALQKLIGEYYGTLFADLYGLETVSLRYFNVYGPHMAEGGAYVTVMSIFKQQYLDGKPLTIYGDGEQTRSFCHVDDVVNANIKAMHSETVGKGEVVNVSGASSVSINHIAKRFNHPIQYLDPRPGDPKHSLGDITKTKELLDWEPEIDFDRGFEDLIQYWGMELS